MSDQTPLLPPVSVLHDRLTKNQRERRLLRALLRLVLLSAREAEDAEEKEPHDQARGREVADGD